MKHLEIMNMKDEHEHSKIKCTTLFHSYQNSICNLYPDKNTLMCLSHYHSDSEPESAEVRSEAAGSRPSNTPKDNFGCQSWCPFIRGV